MKIKNQVQLVGRLGANPEVKNLENGKKVAKFSIAVSETFVNKKGAKVTDVQWHAIVCWDKLANLAEQLLQKGTQVTVDGKLAKREYTNKEGVSVTKVEILARELFVFHKQPEVQAA